jgi:TetR/AcrR family transcriptional repressor of lmrAB and yxaGH operons
MIERAILTSPDPGTAVAAAVAVLADAVEKSDFQWGCALASATLDSAATSDEIRAACAGAFESWIELIAGRLRADGWEPKIAEEEAVVVISAIEGALMLSRARHDTTPLNNVARRLAAGMRTR